MKAKKSRIESIPKILSTSLCHHPESSKNYSVELFINDGDQREEFTNHTLAWVSKTFYTYHAIYSSFFHVSSNEIYIKWIEFYHFISYKTHAFINNLPRLQLFYIVESNFN